MMPWNETRQVLIRELKQTYGGWQAPAVLRVQWVFESFLKVNEGTRRLDQAFKEICVARIALEPKLFEDVMRFVITLFVPALEKRAIKRVFCDVRLSRIDIVITQLSHQPRNPLAFGHGELNLMAAQRMSKPPTTSSSEDTLTRPLSFARERRPLRRTTPCHRK